MRKLLLIGVFFVFITNCFAVTNKDIVDLVNNVKVCDNETGELVSKYKNTFFSLIEERELSDNDLNLIYEKIYSGVSIIKKYNVCKISDKNKIPITKYFTLYKIYRETSELINNAPIKDNNSSNLDIDNHAHDAASNSDSPNMDDSLEKDEIIDSYETDFNKSANISNDDVLVKIYSIISLILTSIVSLFVILITFFTSKYF